MHWKLLFATMVAVVSLGLAGPSLGQSIDYFETPPNPGAQFDFSNAPIPAGFFELGSEPYAGPIELVGDPLDPKNIGRSDTLILRSADPFDPVDLPGPNVVQVDIEIVELNLKSTAPITVVVNGQDTSWDVRVDLGGAMQQPGQQVLTITPPIVLDVQGAPWVHDKNPLLPVFVAPGAGFVPGIEVLIPGDPASQERAPVVAQSVPNPSLPAYQQVLTAPALALHLPALSPDRMAILALLLLGSALLVMKGSEGRRLPSS